MLFAVALIGCGPSRLERELEYGKREIKALKKYKEGDIQAAKEGLLELIPIMSEEATSGLNIGATDLRAALASARLAIIFHQLGDRALEEKYRQDAVTYTSLQIEKTHERFWDIGSSQKQKEEYMINFVSKIDSLHPPHWWQDGKYGVERKID